MAEPISNVRHYGGFLLAGLAALATDAGVLQLLTTVGGLGPFAARPIGIGCALVVSWAINRTIAFAVHEAPTWREFAKFTAASSLAFSVNYLVFASILLAYPGFHPVLAVVCASLVSMFVSYAGYRFGAFRSPNSDP
jgi:putative flippase GtrA